LNQAKVARELSVFVDKYTYPFEALMVVMEVRVEMFIYKPVLI
jgi:hypothetical protein